MQITYETIRNIEKRLEAIEMFINSAIEEDKQKKEGEKK